MRALGEELQAHHEAVLGLLGVGFERAGLAGDQADLDVLGGAPELAAEAPVASGCNAATKPPLRACRARKPAHAILP